MLWHPCATNEGLHSVKAGFSANTARAINAAKFVTNVMNAK